MSKSIKSELEIIPGIGKSIAQDLENIGITKVKDLIGKNPEALFEKSNQYRGSIQDRCLLYVFRCAIYFAENQKHDPEKLKWWHWKD
ncbi:MAG: helix-hairpin-helix domain-containing protein [bacterium]